MTQWADPQPMLDAIDELRREAAELGYIGTDPRAGWHFRLTGYGIHGTTWEHRVLHARKFGRIRQSFLDEFMALVEQKRALEPRTVAPRPRVPRLSSEPLRPWLKHLPETVSVYRADELCIKVLGMHPALVYGDAWWEAA